MKKKPKERVITLPDGRKITVPADGRPGGMGRMRQGGQQNQDASKATGTSEGGKKEEVKQENNTEKSESSEKKEGSPADNSERNSDQSS